MKKNGGQGLALGPQIEPGLDAILAGLKADSFLQELSRDGFADKAAHSCHAIGLRAGTADQSLSAGQVSTDMRHAIRDGVQFRALQTIPTHEQPPVHPSDLHPQEQGIFVDLPLCLRVDSALRSVLRRPARCKGAIAVLSYSHD
ncbi:hypothetical protein I3J13_25240 [Agrobacterium sp. MOPV5]|nr:hypothetical protein [Agrobacterium leguminum]